MAKIIGIGGCSRSGKSLLAQQIKNQLRQSGVLILDMDDFVLPEANIPKIKDRTDWERPESVDFQRLCQTIEEQKHSYELIVVEGILVFSNQQLTSLFETTIWMQISKEIFLQRRNKETRWGEEPDWFIEHVWESYLHYGQFLEADFILSGEEEISEAVLTKVLDR